jgi:hypothetical protein
LVLAVDLRHIVSSPYRTVPKYSLKNQAAHFATRYAPQFSSPLKGKDPTTAEREQTEGGRCLTEQGVSLSRLSRILCLTVERLEG